MKYEGKTFSSSVRYYGNIMRTYYGLYYGDYGLFRHHPLFRLLAACLTNTGYSNLYVLDSRHYTIQCTFRV